LHWPLCIWYALSLLLFSGRTRHFFVLTSRLPITQIPLTSISNVH
jgi:hypothetical protein